MVDAQKYLDEKYPKEGRGSIMKLDLARKDLEGDLDLTEFHQYLKININGNPKLGKIKHDNLITIKIDAQEWLNWKYPDKEETKEIIVEKWEKPEYTLVIKDFPQLEKIRLGRDGKNGLVKVQLVDCPKLVGLGYYNARPFNELTVSACPNLRELSITAGEHLENLDLNGLNELEKIYFNQNSSFTNLDFKNNRKLKDVYIRGTKVKKLDLSNLTELQEIDVSNNELVELNVKGCPELGKISCWSNLLTSLDLTGNIKLKDLDVRYNKLSKEDLIWLDRFDIIRSHLTNVFELKYVGEKRNNKKMLVLQWEGVEMSEDKNYCDSFTVIAGYDEKNLLFHPKFFTNSTYMGSFQKGNIYKFTYWGKLEKGSSNHVELIAKGDFTIESINSVQFIKESLEEREQLKSLNQELKNKVVELEDKLKTAQQKVEQIAQIIIPPK